MQTVVLIVAVGVFGAVGSLARLAMNEAARAMHIPVSLATLAVNVLGCFAIGVLFIMLAPQTQEGSAPLRLTIAPWLAAALVVGLLGAFTTFSTFAIDVLVLMREDRYIAALAYLLASVVIGLCFARLGMFVGEAVCSSRA